MKRRINLFITAICVSMICILFTGCISIPDDGAVADTSRTQSVASELQRNQPTPTDISYSLERYNLIRRAYWVNGMREKANTLPCEIEKPFGYIVLFNGSAAIGSFIVDGKVSSLNSFLTPDSEYYEFVCGSSSSNYNKWLADVDGSYGENDNGIFFFTPDGKYIEWSGEYLYSDIPFEVSNPVLTIGGGKQ